VRDLFLINFVFSPVTLRLLHDMLIHMLSSWSV